LVAAELVKQDDLAAVFTNMAWYFGTVLLGLIIHGGIVLPLLYFFLTRSSPIRFLNNMFQSLATAFGTASRLAQHKIKQDSVTLCVDSEAENH